MTTLNPITRESSMGHDAARHKSAPPPFQATTYMHFCTLGACLLSYIDSQSVYILGRAWPHKTSHLRRTSSSNVGFSAGYPLFFRRFWQFTTLKVIVLDTNLAILPQKTRLWQRDSWDFRRKTRNLMTSQTLLRGLIATPETTFYHGQTLCHPEISSKNTPSQNSNSWIWFNASFRWSNPTMRMLNL